MGIFNRFFHHINETDDEREIREYEKSCNGNSKISDINHSEFIIEDTFAIKGGHTVVVGTVMAGKFSTGDKVIIYSESGNKIKSEILGIEVFMKKVQEIYEGGKAGILLKNVQKNQIRKNDIIKNVPRGTI